MQVKDQNELDAYKLVGENSNDRILILQVQDLQVKLSMAGSGRFKSGNLAPVLSMKGD